MCGIAGFVGNGNQEDLDQMVTQLEHRGPDNSGFFIDFDVATYLGHRRLNVVDISGGAQPMKTPDNELVVNYNGEIYNANSLREELENYGHIFQSNHSDTEVLLYGYREWGQKLVQKLNGMWAFAIYDKEDKSIFIARDRMGIKPLLIYQDNDKIIFGSEMKALLSFDIEKNIDRASLFTYLQLNYIPAPHSILENVTKLEAGSYLQIKSGKIEFKVEKNGIVHVGVAKMSFEKEKIIQNISVFIDAIKKAKPSGVKGIYMKKVTLSSTMGPGIKLDHGKVL